MGNTTGDTGLFEIDRFNSSSGSSSSNGSSDYLSDGSVRDNVWGTYIHGLFDNDGLRSDLLNSLRKSKGLPEQEKTAYQEIRENAINRWAGILGKSIDLCFILRQVGMEYCMKKVTEDVR
jgi:adenosylcobyric acid synthase